MTIKTTTRFCAAFAAVALWMAPQLQAQTRPVGHSQPAQASTDKKAADQPKRDIDPALWVVSDEDTTIWLFGSIHMLKSGLGWFDDEVRTAFDSADELVLEMVQPEPNEARLILMRIAFTSGIPSLREKLSPKARTEFETAMTGLNMPEYSYDQLDPWFAAANLSMLPLLKNGYSPENGVEYELTAAAETAGKPVSGLETMEQQLKFFDDLPEDQQIEYLNNTVETLGDTLKNVDAMVHAWGADDQQKLKMLINDGYGEADSHLHQVILTSRNKKWAEWIRERLAKPGKVFIAVGAGHLTDSDSVQAQLAAMGISSRKIDY